MSSKFEVIKELDLMGGYEPTYTHNIYSCGKEISLQDAIKVLNQQDLKIKELEGQLEEAMTVYSVSNDTALMFFEDKQDAEKVAGSSLAAGLIVNTLSIMPSSSKDK